MLSKYSCLSIRGICDGLFLPHCLYRLYRLYRQVGLFCLNSSTNFHLPQVPPLKTMLSDATNKSGYSEPGNSIADVFEGREYNFICGASGSNPAATFRWRLGTTNISDSAYTYTRAISGHGGWDATSRLSLSFQQDHHAQKLTCDVMYPTGDNVFKRQSVELNVIAGKANCNCQCCNFFVEIIFVFQKHDLHNDISNAELILMKLLQTLA